jgi:predicted phage replisome organizer
MSDVKKYYYLKLKEGFFDREDIKVLEAMENGILYSNIYLKLCLLSLKNDGALLFNGLIPYNEKMLSTVTGQNIDVIRQAIKILSNDALKLIEVMNDGTIYLTQIQELVGHGSSEGERKAKYRLKLDEKKKLTMGQCPGHFPPEIEIELEKEIEKETVEPAKRDLVHSEADLKEADFILRFHKAEEFALFVNVIKKMIENENKERGGRNPFTWTATSKRGTIEADLTNLIYKFNDEKKKELLKAVYNVVEYKLNWPHLVKLAILHTIRTSRTQPIKKPHDFTMWFIQRPADIAASKAEGPLSDKWITKNERDQK